MCFFGDGRSSFSLFSSRRSSHSTFHLVNQTFVNSRNGKVESELLVTVASNVPHSWNVGRHMDVGIKNGTVTVFLVMWLHKFKSDRQDSSCSSFESPSWIPGVVFRKELALCCH